MESLKLTVYEILITAVIVSFMWIAQPAKAYRIDETPLIVGGDEVDIADFPHHLALYNFQSGAASYFCGASNIHRLWAITAAHCFGINAVASSIRLYGGSSNRLIGGVFFNVERFVNHPRFSRATLDFDISVIKVDDSTPLEGHPHVSPIKLPAPCELTCCGACPNDALVEVSGWGRTDSGLLATMLKAVSKRLMGNEQCSPFWRSPAITDRMVCTPIENGRDSCHGDSGSAMVRHGVQVGMVSFGSSVCGDGSRPAVYVRLEDVQIRYFITIYAGV